MNIQERLENLSKVAEEKLKAINIPIKSVARYTVSDTKAWGDCRRRKTYNGDIYSIRITRSLLEQGSDDKVVQTLMHELVHTACFDDNHTGMFKVYGRRIMSAYPQYNISRTNSAEELGVDKTASSNYVVKCECGRQFCYTRKANIIQDLIRKENGMSMLRTYHCPYCKTRNSFTLVKR